MANDTSLSKQVMIYHEFEYEMIDEIPFSSYFIIKESGRIHGYLPGTGSFVHMEVDYFIKNNPYIPQELVKRLYETTARVFEKE